jgi:two-component system response regulator RegX3
MGLAGFKQFGIIMIIHKGGGRMHYNCLIVDDETDLAKMTCEYFQMFDVSCAYVETALECEIFLRENQVDVLLMDINLKDESGFNICKKIRQESDIPILFISARQSDDDVLIALNIGGDDYIKKPYSLSILLAKVKAVLKRYGSNEQLEPVHAGAFIIDPAAMRVYRNGVDLKLKTMEFKLFFYLYQNLSKVITKDKLFQNVWGDSFFSDGTLNVHIRRLREKIEEDPNNPKIIQTIWGTGYIMEL